MGLAPLRRQGLHARGHVHEHAEEPVELALVRLLDHQARAHAAKNSP